MQGELWPSVAISKGHVATPSLRERLYRATSGEGGLIEAAQTLAYYQEEQARLAADLLERESWALTMILSALEPIWPQLASGTLRFIPDLLREPSTYHLELGRFAHLASLPAPSPGEQALMASTTLCWARVYAHQDRKLAGQTGALACSYVPIPVSEAIATLGLGRILEVIEAATSGAGRALVNREHVLGERLEHLLRVEAMLGWVPHPVDTRSKEAAAVQRLVYSLLRPDARARNTVTALLFLCLAIPLCSLTGVFGLLLLAALLCSAVLIAWMVAAA